MSAALRAQEVLAQHPDSRVPQHQIDQAVARPDAQCQHAHQIDIYNARIYAQQRIEDIPNQHAQQRRIRLILHAAGRGGQPHQKKRRREKTRTRNKHIEIRLVLDIHIEQHIQHQQHQRHAADQHAGKDPGHKQPPQQAHGKALVPLATGQEGYRHHQRHRSEHQRHIAHGGC